jgi:hypothetical protein
MCQGFRAGARRNVTAILTSSASEKFFSGGKRFWLPTDKADQRCQRFPYRDVVVNNKDDWGGLRLGCTRLESRCPCGFPIVLHGSSVCLIPLLTQVLTRSRKRSWMRYELIRAIGPGYYIPRLWRSQASRTPLVASHIRRYRSIPSCNRFIVAPVMYCAPVMNPHESFREIFKEPKHHDSI